MILLPIFKKIIPGFEFAELSSKISSIFSLLCCCLLLIRMFTKTFKGAGPPPTYINGY